MDTKISSAESLSLPRTGGRRLSIQRKKKRRNMRFTKFGEATDLFRKASRIVMHCLSWIRILEEIKDVSDGHSKTLMELIVEYQVDIADKPVSEETDSPFSGTHLHFDKNAFKANRDISLSAELKEVLTIHPNARSKEMCQKLMLGLQILHSFTDYPLQMQENLCQVAWYQRVTPKRIIIRQGHPAENFYFVISGQALVKLGITDDNTGLVYNKTIARLQRDDCFGETGLLYQSERTITVESATDMELLSVMREDYLRIFMKASGPDDEPDHVKFCRQLPFLNHWPMEILQNNPRQCLTSFFRRNSLIFTNSEETEYIYIIKSGTVQILNKLYRVNDQQQPKSSRSSTHVTPHCSIENAGTSALEQQKQRSRISVDAELFAQMVSPASASALSRNASTLQNKTQDLEATENTNPQIILTHCDALVEDPKIPELASEPHRDPQSEQKGEYVMKEYTSFSEDNTTQNVFFVEVGELHPGDVFGLHNLIFNHETPIEQPNLSMVSKGAEIIMLSKNFFILNVNDKVRQYIRENVRPYPLEQMMQNKLREKAAWKHYKKMVLEDYIHQRDKITELHRKFPTM